MGTISHDDWSLDRRGQLAQSRHKEKVKKAIKQNLGKMIADEGLIVSDGRNIIRIPVQSMDEPHFYFNHGKSSHAGQGDGEKGEAIGQAEPGSGYGPGAGENPGEKVFEAEITIDEIEDLLFADLKLPRLSPKAPKEITVEDLEWNDVRNKGIESNLDRKRTFFQALKRSQTTHLPLKIEHDDFRYKTWEEEVRPHVGAVIIAMMDVSGSMGEFEKFVSRTFFFWMERFLKKHYPQVEMRYLVHHTEAYEVSQNEFYRIREGGGTKCSSVYELALELIQEKYPLTEWNIYPVHVSDGDNTSVDNDKSANLVKQLCGLSSLFAYLEVQARAQATTLGHVFHSLDCDNLRNFRVQARDAIIDALRYFFREEDVS